MNALNFAPALRRGATCFVRLQDGSTTEMYTSQADGKVCVKYKLTPKATEYWCRADEVQLAPPEEPAVLTRSSRRTRKRTREDEPAEEDNTEQKQQDEEDDQTPRPALSNGRLYGVLDVKENRKPFAKDGKVNVNECKDCHDDLSTQPYVLFIQRSSSKTVKRRYGDLGESHWSKTSFQTVRDYYCPNCWKVPKAAQQSLRGKVDIVGLELVGDAAKQSEFLENHLPLLADN